MKNMQLKLLYKNKITNNLISKAYAYVFVINQMKRNNNKIIANRNQTNEIQNNAKALRQKSGQFKNMNLPKKGKLRSGPFQVQCST